VEGAASQFSPLSAASPCQYMRIVGGSLKGRPLQGPRTSLIRPTADRLRESLFNILAHSYGDPAEGARVLDVFAGTGAMGFEALSRGSSFALFIDQSFQADRLIRRNAAALDLLGTTRTVRRDARKLGIAGQQGRYNLAFLDPPYGRGLITPALESLREGGWLEAHALILIEEGGGVRINLPPGFTLLEERQFGDTQVLFAAFEAPQRG